MTQPAIKKFVGASLNKIGQERALDEIRRQGKCLPCKVINKKGSIVQVEFNVDSDFTLPNITIPHFGPTWIRYPTQPGDLGITLAADVQIGSVSGLGGGAPSLSIPANLTPLFFMPLANAAWSTVDPNALVLNGPNGVVLRDTAGTCTFTLTPIGIVIVIGGMTMTINSAGINIQGGDISVGNIPSYLMHEHNNLAFANASTAPIAGT